MVKIKKSASPGYYVTDGVTNTTLSNVDGKFYSLWESVDFNENDFLFPTIEKAKLFCMQIGIDAVVRPEASIVDKGESYVELHIGGKYAGDVFYRSPNVVSFGGKKYFVETPFSSTDEKYHVYELGRELEI